jgi:hypothetical protein
MKKILSFCFALCFFGAVNNVSAQVTVGSTATPNATLDVVGKPADTAAKDGVIIPRLTVSQLQSKLSAYGSAQNSALVYISDKPASTLTGKMAKVRDAGFYYFKYVDGTNDQWLPLGTGNASWFYLPSTKIDVRFEAPLTKTLDLFAAYKEQLRSSDGTTDLGYTVKSDASAPNITDFMTLDASATGTDYYYYVVGFDENVFDKTSISITAAGELHYTVRGVADESTFINIVIVKK